MYGCWIVGSNFSANICTQATTKEEDEEEINRSKKIAYEAIFREYFALR